MVGPTETPVERFVGIGLMAVGGLIATLCGLCTIRSVLSILKHPPVPRAAVSDMVTGVLTYGGVGTAIGIGLFFAGRALARRREDEGSRREDSENVDERRQ